MKSIDDVIFNSLREKGYTGSIGDMLYHYWLDNEIKSIDRYAYLKELGYTGSIDEMLLHFFEEPQEWAPSRLFNQEEAGAWYDPSDLTTLFQDAAGTIPVTADGQPVGRMVDKSGNGNHALQTTALSRPIFKTDGTLSWLDFDSKFLSIASLAMEGTAAGGIHTSVATTRVVAQCFLEMSTSAAANNGTMSLLASAGKWIGRARGTTSADATNPNVYPTTPRVIEVVTNLATPTVSLKSNGATVATAAPGVGTLSNHATYIGMRAGTMIPFLGQCYGLIITGRTLITDEQTKLQTYLATKSGITI